MYTYKLIFARYMNTRLYFFRFSLGFLLILAAVFSSLSYAERVGAMTVPPTTCVMLSSNLRLGNYNHDVTELQVYLAKAGYFYSNATGYFGPLTFSAVTRYQGDHGLPRTGYVGPLTRAIIQTESCNGTPIPNPTPTGSVSIVDINPASATIGTMVTITGRGFTSTGNTINFGSGTISNLSATHATCVGLTPCATGLSYINFTIPSSISPYCAPGMMCALYMQMVTPGIYPISVTNAYGTSNSVNFTVSGSGGATLSITGIDAPSTLPIGVPGTWTVRAIAQGGSNLHYNVTWGDEAAFGGGGFAAPQQYPVSGSATFTHTYYRAGTYSPTFTVTDDFGHTGSATATIVVTPMY